MDRLPLTGIIQNLILLHYFRHFLDISYCKTTKEHTGETE